MKINICVLDIFKHGPNIFGGRDDAVLNVF